jgi:hypothetical protein
MDLHAFGKYTWIICCEEKTANVYVYVHSLRFILLRKIRNICNEEYINVYVYIYANAAVYFTSEYIFSASLSFTFAPLTNRFYCSWSNRIL